MTLRCKICGKTRDHAAAMTAHLGVHSHTDMYEEVDGDP